MILQSVVLLAMVCCSVPVVVSAEKAAATTTNVAARPSVFMMPRLFDRFAQGTTVAMLLTGRGDTADAEAVCRKLAADLPFFPLAHYNLACVQAERGNVEAAFRSLETAITLGYTDVAHMLQDTDLDRLRSDPRFEELMARAQRTPPWTLRHAPRPALVADNVASVRESNTVWDIQHNLLRTLFRFPAQPPAGRDVILEHGKVGELLRAWFKEGSAAGNWGDLYDNRDSKHSNLDGRQFPQLSRIEYARKAVEAGMHFGPQLAMLHAGVVVGNSSTAEVGNPFWRSQTRLALMLPQGPARLYAQYASDKLYVYPAHKDYRPGNDGEGRAGDVFAFNTPCVIISQGSSGTDKPFLDAVFCTLAAFRPDVKKMLTRTGALMPTVQMIFRMSNKPVAKPDDYLTGAAHPPVFEAANLNVEKMVTLAHEMTRTNLPPVIQLQVLEEDHAVNGRDYFDIPGDRERLFDTPCAIARVWRSTQHRRHLVVSATGSRDLNGRPLTYRWAVLQGDPDAVRIKPLTTSGSVAEISLTYPARRPVRPGSQLESNRVDIGVFAHNGTWYSAPGFVTFFSLANEARSYSPDGRILSVTYTGADGKGIYVDPMLDLPKNWRDEYHYDSENHLTGWTRRRGDATEEFTAAGELIVRRDPQGQPVETRRVRYVAQPRGKNEPSVLKQEVEKPANAK
ncbi:MAG: hypothetical protein FJ388_05370 [Verrucomicrobia bacterium]|nr:hypothetical protein [Verrucomicrobiota bacterium]